MRRMRSSTSASSYGSARNPLGIDAQDGFRREIIVQNGVQRGPGRARQMQEKERFIHGVFPGAYLYTSPGPFRKRGGRAVLASAA